ncbi:hypothetical protein BLNAU_9267 [Blattamonas nauphoetae]|uniref:Protein kinase domain-containing protein n=1 Tax=Blattamonas nauphoetae TaxID=2049346 RepID=A0ABQ9XW63_9EUKA|nr:hypothetical protein BLNAU_9267 [Blattamonas nauphoetae]
MLGCVVSLTSSHLSGSTIRDVNTVGCVLCSNSSFSSLLPSPNTDPNEEPTVILADGSEGKFADGVAYYWTSSFGDKAASFTHCHFTGGSYSGSQRPIGLYDVVGPVSIVSCSFTNFASTGSNGGAVWVYRPTKFDHTCLTIKLSNFTSWSSTKFGGAVYVRAVDGVLVDSCCFEECSTTADLSEGGAFFLEGLGAANIPHFEVVDCVIAGCTATKSGAGVHVFGTVDLKVVRTKFEHCELTAGSAHTRGGGLNVNGQVTLTVEGIHFIECSSRHAGGAIHSAAQKEVNISDTLVKECSSGTTGAICICRTGASEPVSFSHVYLVGNSVGDDTTFFTAEVYFGEDATKFPDIAFLYPDFTVEPTIEFEDCFTTITPDSTGMIMGRTKLESGLYDPERIYDDEFNKIGPLLTATPTARVNEKTGKIELEIQGKTPLTSQEYEVTMKDEDGTETRFRMLFSDGTGIPVSGSDVNLKYNTNYTIISIVGIVAGYSSSRMTNGITIPAIAWSFHLAATPNILSFTTPEEPSITPPEPPVTPPETPSFSTLQAATAHLIKSDPQSAFVVLLFDNEVCGSYDFVVLEEGKPVTLTITAETSSISGETNEFKVIGNGKLLTHDTTYTIESLTPTPNTDSPTDVRMNRTVTFHIPKSSAGNNKSQLSPETKKRLSWLIPLVACLLVALLVAIIIVVLLRRRKQKKNALPAQTEMEAQEQVVYEEKVDVLADDPTRDVFSGEDRSHSAFDASSALPTNRNPSSRGENSKSMTNGDLVEVMACSGGFEVSVVGDYTTLYSVLHKEKREIGKRMIGLQVVNGLKAVLANRQSSDVVTRLSSHWILVDSAGNVQLKLEMNAAEAELEAAQTKRQDGGLDGNGTVQNLSKDVEQAGMDGLRWRAPEVVAGGGSTVDGHKAAVFSLGLVLWEIETGQVPFGELDAVNAQRQSGTGIGPKMESLQNEEFIALILQCVSANPEQRPSLSEIGEFLSSHPEDSNTQSHNDMKE